MDADQCRASLDVARRPEVDHIFTRVPLRSAVSEFVLELTTIRLWHC